MINEIDNKKVENKYKKIIPLFILIVFFIVLIISATFAYFMVIATNDRNETTIGGEAGSFGSVAFDGEDVLLILDLTNEEMMQRGEDVTYYASKDGATTNETKETMGIISVAGEGVFDCRYSLNISASSNSEETNMYTKFQNMAGKSVGQIVLTLNNQDGDHIYDFYNENLFLNNVITYNGEANGIEEGNPEIITAELKMVNKTEVVQDDLIGSDITLTFLVNDFTCEIVG